MYATRGNRHWRSTLNSTSRVSNIAFISLLVTKYFNFEDQPKTAEKNKKTKSDSLSLAKKLFILSSQIIRLKLTQN